MLVGDSVDSRGIRASHRVVQYSVGCWSLGSYSVCQGKGHPFRTVLESVSYGDLHDPGVWREIEVFSFCEKACAEVWSVLCNVLIDRVLGIGSLDHEGTPPRAAAATAAKLQKQLMSTLIRAEILHSEKGIRSDDCHKAEVAEVESFADHLRSDQNVDLASAELPDGFLFIIPVLGGVAVQSCDPCLREQCRSLFLYLLCAGSEQFHRAAAFRAGTGTLSAETAIVTSEAAVVMQAEAHIAVRTFRYVAALLALYHRRPCASRPEDEHLLTCTYGSFDSFYEFPREVADHSVLPSLISCVDDLYFRIGGSVEFLLQFHEDMSSHMTVVLLFQGRCSRAEDDVAAFMYAAEHQRGVSSVISWGRGVLLV